MPWIGHSLAPQKKSGLAKKVVACSCGWRGESEPSTPPGRTWRRNHLAKVGAEFRHRLPSPDRLHIEPDDDGTVWAWCDCGWRSPSVRTDSSWVLAIHALCRDHVTRAGTVRAQA